MHQPLFVSETKMKSACVSSILINIHRWIAIESLCYLSQTRVLTEEKTEIRLDHCQYTFFAVTFSVELVEAVFGATEKQF